MLTKLEVKKKAFLSLLRKKKGNLKKVLLKTATKPNRHTFWLKNDNAYKEKYEKIIEKYPSFLKVKKITGKIQKVQKVEEEKLQKLEKEKVQKVEVVEKDRVIWYTINDSRGVYYQNHHGSAERLSLGTRFNTGDIGNKPTQIFTHTELKILLLNKRVKAE